MKKCICNKSENQVFVYWGSGGMHHSVTDTHIDSLIYWSNGWNYSVSVFPGNLEKRPGRWMCSYWSQHYWKPVYKLKSSSYHWSRSKKINIATLYPCLVSLNNALGKKIHLFKWPVKLVLFLIDFKFCIQSYLSYLILMHELLHTYLT